MIELRDVIKEYNLSKNKKNKALDNINLKFSNLGLVSILGKSGCGKTTLLNVIAGIVKPTQGSVQYDTLNSIDMKDNDYDYLRNYYFGFIFQDIYLIETLTVYENIEISLQLQGLDKTTFNDKIEAVLKKLDLLGLKDSKASELSGGEKQRVCIARSLIKGCKVLLADEPTGSLDQENAKIVYDTLKQISNDILVIMVTHDIESANEISDRIIKIDYGKIKETINNTTIEVNELPQENKVNKFFLIPYLSRKITRKQKFRVFFTSIFWLFGLTISMFALNFTSFDQYDFIYNTLGNNSINSFKVTDNIFGSEINDFDDSKLKEKDYPSIKFNDYYDFSFFDYEYFDPNNTIGSSNINLPFYGRNVVKSFIIKDIEDDTVALTDFSISMLINYGLLNKTSVNDCIGAKIMFNNNEFTISGIIDTDYEFYINNEKLHDVKNIEYTQYLNKKNNEFTIGFINEKTLQKIIPAETMFQSNINDFICFIKDIDSSDLDSESYLGSFPNASNEIIVSPKVLSDSLKLDITEEEYLIDYINQEYDFNFLYKNKEVNKKYKITGIVYSDSSVVYLKNSEFFNLCQEYKISSLTRYPKHLYIELGNKEDSLKLIKDIMFMEGFPYIYLSQEIYFIITNMLSYKNFAQTSSIIMVVFLILMILFFTTNLIKQNKKIIGILSTLGVSKNTLLLIFIYENLKLLFISFIISFALNIISIISININIKNTMKVTIDTLKIQPLIVLGVILLAFIVVIISSFYPIYKFRRKELIEIIYDK